MFGALAGFEPLEDPLERRCSECRPVPAAFRDPERPSASVSLVDSTVDVAEVLEGPDRLRGSLP